MALKGVKTSIAVRVRPGAEREVYAAVLGGLVEFAQDVVAYAAKKSGHPYTDRTGVNSRSIGWAASGWGDSGWGTVSTGKGNTSSAGAGSSSAQSVDVLIATTSGYGGWLETGTVHMRPYPYIVPAVMANKGKLKQALTGVI